MTSDLYSRSPEKIILYGTSWCGNCRSSRRVFAQVGTPYEDIDIDADERAESFVKEINRGNRSVPTIVFPDGAIMVEPSDDELAAKLKSLA
ncbi:MAG: glutaredoxin domain-containing protein [Anaerolineales bacterium]|jgi:mycoredoxin|nr:glutaredoxin domain-containing protein [Anaerolineales bacterium]